MLSRGGITQYDNRIRCKFRGILQVDRPGFVGGFDPALRLYTATVTGSMLHALADAGFVGVIEPIGIVEAAHDTAAPAMGADALRLYDGSPGIFTGTGGAFTPIAVVDTGLNINHLDIASNRSSICGANFAWNSSWFWPDGEHLYLSMPSYGILTFARNPAPRPGTRGLWPSTGECNESH